VKIVHLTHTFIPEDSRILKEMMALAEDASFQVEGIGVAPLEGVVQTQSQAGMVVHSLFILTRRWRFLPAQLRRLFALIEWYVRLVRLSLKLRPDVVHCHDTPALIAGLIVSRVSSAKLIYDAHELESRKNAQSPWTSRLTFYAEKLSWRSIHHLISVSPSILDWYLTALGSKPATLVLNSPHFDADDLMGKADDDPRLGYFRKRFDIPPDVKIFLYLGLLVQGRGIEMLLEVFSSPQLSSHIVFMGRGTLSDCIEQAAASNSKIHLHPAVPHHMVVSISKAADYGLCFVENVSLSDYYCLPNKLFEYAFAGLPVLASNFPDIARVVSAHDLGDCFDPDLDALRAAVIRTERNSSAPSMRDLGQLSWQTQARRLQLAYANVLQRG
jgi:glycosyltransferase involved in cell wall biosynthesis